MFSLPSPSLQTVTAELVLRFRRKRRRSLRRWARLSACFQTQRKSLAMTAVRIWRMMAWTWEVSTWASLGVGGLKGEQIKVQARTEPMNLLFIIKRLSLLWWEPVWKVLCVDVDSFCLHQILMPTTFSRLSLEAQEVLVLKVIYLLYVYKNLWEMMLFYFQPFWEYISYWLACCSFQHLDQEISSSSLVNWRIRLPKQLLHQDFSTMSTPRPTIHI